MTISNSTFNPFNGTLDGINEKGLFIQEATNGFPQEYNRTKGNQHPGRPAVHTLHLMFIALQTCATIDEVVTLFKKTPVWFSTWVSHYLISDPSGRSVIIEYDLDNKPVFYFRHGGCYQLMTNVALQRGIYFVSGLCRRFSRGIEVLQDPISNSSDMMKLMTAMRSTGVSKTLWTTIADLSARKIEIYFGSENFAVPHPFAIPFNDRQPQPEIPGADLEPEENPVVKPVKIPEKSDPAFINSYVGKYKFNDHWFVSISREQDQLYIQNTGVRKGEMHPLVEDQFIIPENQFKIIFVRGTHGQVTKLDFIAHGIKYSARKINAQPGNDYIAIFKLRWIVCGILFLLFIGFYVGRWIIFRFKADEKRMELKKHSTKFARLTKIWILATTFISLASVIVLLFLNDLNLLEKLINFHVYQPGTDEMALSWILVISLFSSLVFVIFMWFKHVWPIWERILITVAAGAILCYFLDMSRLGLVTLFG
jgi:hypothetical protein